MDISMILLAIPVFFLVFRGAAMMMSSRRSTRGSDGYRTKRLSADSFRKFSRWAGESGFNQAFLKLKGFRERLDLLLLRSGHPFGWRTEDLLFYKEGTVVFTAIFLWALDVQDLTVWILSLVIAFWALDIYLHFTGSTRKAQMQRALPGFVDLIALLMESGLDLLLAIERILERMNAGPLRDELQSLLQESRLGAARKDVLQRWARRTDLNDAQSLSSLIIQSEEMGTPLSSVLRSYAEDMRNRRVLRAEEIAGKIPVKILFPMIVFFFPIVFVIILGPMALEFMKGSK